MFFSWWKCLMGCLLVLNGYLLYTLLCLWRFDSLKCVWTHQEFFWRLLRWYVYHVLLWNLYWLVLLLKDLDVLITLLTLISPIVFLLFNIIFCFIKLWTQLSDHHRAIIDNLHSLTHWTQANSLHCNGQLFKWDFYGVIWF